MKRPSPPACYKDKLKSIFYMCQLSLPADCRLHSPSCCPGWELLCDGFTPAKSCMKSSEVMHCILCKVLPSYDSKVFIFQMCSFLSNYAISAQFVPIACPHSFLCVKPSIQTVQWILGLMCPKFFPRTPGTDLIEVAKIYILCNFFPLTFTLIHDY